MIHIYPSKYRTMQQRFLFVAVSKFGKLQVTADMLKISKQHLNNILKKGKIPLKYASYLSELLELPIALFDYELDVLVNYGTAITFEAFVSSCEELLPREKQYILQGKSPGKPSDLRKKLLEDLL